MNRILSIIIGALSSIDVTAQEPKPLTFHLDTINVKGIVRNVDGSLVSNAYIKTTSQDTLLQNDVIWSKTDSLGHFSINGIKPYDSFTIFYGSQEYHYFNQASRFITITINPYLKIKTDTSSVLVSAKRLKKKEKAKYKIDNYLICAFPTFNKESNFPAGKKAFLEFIYKQLIYPEAAVRNNIEGKVTIEFFINKDGSVFNPKIINGIGYGCDEIVIDAIHKSPRWNPAIENSKPVISKARADVLFRLND